MRTILRFKYHLITISNFYSVICLHNQIHVEKKKKKKHFIHSSMQLEIKAHDGKSFSADFLNIK